jgi:hypothetical protein
VGDGRLSVVEVGGPVVNLVQVIVQEVGVPGCAKLVVRAFVMGSGRADETTQALIPWVGRSWPELDQLALEGGPGVQNGEEPLEV